MGFWGQGGGFWLKIFSPFGPLIFGFNPGVISLWGKGWGVKTWFNLFDISHGKGNSLNPIYRKVFFSPRNLGELFPLN